MENSCGKYLKLTVTGSSHGDFVGGVLENCPQGVFIDRDLLSRELERRKPHAFGTPRKEDDEVIWLKGVENNETNGEKIVFEVKNKNIRPADYDKFRNEFRPSHADYVYYVKYGEDSLRHKDNASARMFLPVVVAGFIAKQILAKENISVSSDIVSLNGHEVKKSSDIEKLVLNISEIVLNTDKIMLNTNFANSDKNFVDTFGGKIRCEIKGVKAGLGEPIFEKLSSNLAKAVMNIPSAVSFSIGEEENRDALLGSEDIDEWNDDFTTVTNHCGGINAGISNGMPIVFYAGFHAVHTLSAPMTLISKDGKKITKQISGRHDKAAILRTPVIVEAVSALVIADFLLQKTINKNENSL